MYEAYLVHLYAHKEHAQNCQWCGPWPVLQSVTL
jgi:hypothetical protein